MRRFALYLFVLAMVCVATAPPAQAGDRFSSSDVTNCSIAMSSHAFTTVKHSYVFAGVCKYLGNGQMFSYTMKAAWSAEAGKAYESLELPDGRKGNTSSNCSGDPWLNTGISCTGGIFSGDAFFISGNTTWLSVSQYYPVSKYALTPSQKVTLINEAANAPPPSPPPPPPPPSTQVAPTITSPAENAVFRIPKNTVNFVMTVPWKPGDYAMWRFEVQLERVQTARKLVEVGTNTGVAQVQPVFTIPFTHDHGGSKAVKKTVGKYRFRARAVSNFGRKDAWSPWRHFEIQALMFENTGNLKVVPGVPLPKSITVTKPNGGQNWSVNQTKNVTWTSTGLTGKVRIVLRKGDSFYKNLTGTAGTDNDGEFSWTIAPNIQQGSNYRIRVRNMDNSVRDDSDAVFTINN